MRNAEFKKEHHVHISELFTKWQNNEISDLEMVELNVDLEKLIWKQIKITLTVRDEEIDMFSDTFLKLVINRHKFDATKSSVATWVSRLARLHIDTYNREKVRRLQGIVHVTDKFTNGTVGVIDAIDIEKSNEMLYSKEQKNKDVFIEEFSKFIKLLKGKERIFMEVMLDTKDNGKPKLSQRDLIKKMNFKRTPYFELNRLKEDLQVKIKDFFDDNVMLHSKGYKHCVRSLNYVENF